MDFKIIAITRPDFFPEEADRITRILENDEAEFVHIRKPDSLPEHVATLIKAIPSHLHQRLKLHDHFSLLDSFNLAGVHLNSRNPIPPKTAYNVSKSCHSVSELADSDNFDYVTLSPIFDSISKLGYKAAFNLDDLKFVLKEKKNIIALGGVTPNRFSTLRSLGFSGAALLSFFFPLDPHPSGLRNLSAENRICGEHEFISSKRGKVYSSI